MAEKLIEQLRQSVKSQQETYQFITTDSKGAEIAVPFGKPFYTDDMSVVFIDENYNTAFLHLHDKSDTIPSEFSWAQERFEQAQAEWDKIEKSDAKPLLDNFRQRGGIFTIDKSKVNNLNYFNAIQKALKKEVYDIPPTIGVRGEMATDKNDNRPIRYILSLSSTIQSPTTLIHELTHAGDGGISHSALFTQCWNNDKMRGSKIVSDTYRIIQEQKNSGNYTEEQTSLEMIARLSERRHENPDQFKEECPYVDAFLTKVFYPALKAQTAALKDGERIGNQEAASYLQDVKLLSGQFMLPTEKEQQTRTELFSQFDKIQSEDRKCQISIHNISSQIENIESILKLNNTHARADRLHKELQSHEQQKQKMQLQEKQLVQDQQKQQQSMAAFIDNSPSSISMMRAMDEFQNKMQSLTVDTITSHIEIVQPPKIQNGNPQGLSGRLRQNSSEQPLNHHNAIDIREAYKDKKLPKQIQSDKTNSHETEREKRQREIMEQMMGIKKGFSL